MPGLSLIWLKKGGAHRGPALGGDYQGHVDFWVSGKILDTR